MESWKVKVPSRATLTYLWGGEGVDEPLDIALVLTIRVDELGEPVAFGRRAAPTSNPIKSLGQLKPGETVSLSLKNVQGVWARCVDPKVDTFISCSITAPYGL